MSTKLSQTDRYEASPEQIWAMVSDPAYAPAKYEFLGDLSFDVQQHDASDAALTTKVDRTVSSNMTGPAAKLLGDKSQMVQTEKWASSGDGLSSNIVIESPGKPLTITGGTEVTTAGDGVTDWIVTFDIKAGVPLVGGKIEKMVSAETQKNLGKEYEFNKKWLSEH